MSDHPHGLAGTFPGSPYAFTAMLAQRIEGQVRWRTWHAYPQEGQLVVTRTRVGCASRRRRSEGRGRGRASPGRSTCTLVGDKRRPDSDVAFAA